MLPDELALGNSTRTGEEAAASVGHKLVGVENPGQIVVCPPGDR